MGSGQTPRPALCALLLCSFLAAGSARLHRTPHQLQERHGRAATCPRESEQCPTFGLLPTDFKSVVCSSRNSVLVVAVGYPDYLQVKEPARISPEGSPAVTVNRNMADGAVSIQVSDPGINDEVSGNLNAEGSCKTFKAKLLYDISPGGLPRHLHNMTELLVSKECDTHGVFSEPAYAVVVARRRLNEEDLSSLGLGEGYSLFLLPDGHTTVPACTESRPLLNQPEVVLPSEPEPRDTLVDCKLRDVPGVPHQCPLCASKMTRQLQEDICTASTALVVKKNVERISADLETPLDMPILRLSRTLISRKYNQIDIQIQERPPPSSMLNETGQAKCTKGSLTILDDVTPGGINTEANRINFELSQGCSCDFLGQGTDYAVLLSDKSLSDIGRTVQLDNTFKLVSLDKGMTNLSACSDQDVMMSDGHAASYGEEDVGCSAPPTTCPRCHNTLVPELYPLICDAPTLVRVLSMNPAHRDDTGTFCGKARVIQAHRGNVDDYAKTISYSLLDSCNCDYVTKPSRQYYAFISGPRPSQGLTLKHLVMTDQVHMVAYSYRNARLLDDALKICQTPKAEKRNDGFGYVGDQAYQQSQGHATGYGGASSALYGSGSGHGASGGASYPSGHSKPKPAGYSHVQLPGGYGAAYDQSSATAQPSAYGTGATYAPARAPSYGATYAPAHASSYGATPASAYGSQNAPYGHAQPSGYDAPYKAAASLVSYSSPPGYGSAYAPGHSSGHAASYTSAPAYSYSSGAPLGYGASSGYGTASAPSYGSSATPSYAAVTTSSYGSAAPAPSYGHPDSSGYGSGYAYSHGSAGPAYAAAPSPGYSSAGAAYAVTSAPGYGSSGPAYGPAPAHGYNSAGDGAAYAPAPSSKQGYAGATYNSAQAPGYASSGVAYAAAPGPAYGASGPVYAAGAAPGHGAAPSSYARAPARNYEHGGSASSYGAGYGTAPSYGSSPSSNYPASGSYNNNADKYPSQAQAYGGGPRGGYRAQGNYAQNGGGYASSGAYYEASYATDTTYAPSYGMSDYESLYPSEEDYAPVISYMPTYAPLDEYSAQTAASATYAAPSYNAGYGATYHQPGASGSYAPPVYAPQSYPSGNSPQVHVTYSVPYSPGSASHGPPAYAAPGYKNPVAAAGYSEPASYVPSMGHYRGAAAPSSASYNSPSRDYNNVAASSGGYSQVQHSSSGASYAPAAYQPHATGYGTETVPSSAYHAPAPYIGSGAGYKAGAAPVAAHYAPAFRGSSAGNYGAGAAPAPSSAFYGSSAGSYGAGAAQHGASYSSSAEGYGAAAAPSSASYAPASYAPHSYGSVTAGYGAGVNPSSVSHAPAPYSSGPGSYGAGARPSGASYVPASYGPSVGNYKAGAAPSSASYGPSAGTYGAPRTPPGTSYAPASYSSGSGSYKAGAAPSSASYATPSYGPTSGSYGTGSAPSGASYAPASYSSGAKSYGAGSAPPSAAYGPSAGIYGAGASYKPPSINAYNSGPSSKSYSSTPASSAGTYSTSSYDVAPSYRSPATARSDNSHKEGESYTTSQAPVSYKSSDTQSAKSSPTYEASHLSSLRNGATTYGVSQPPYESLHASYAPPSYAQPVHSQPSYVASYAPPAYAAPSYAPAGYEVPSYAPPLYGQPSNGPSHAAPPKGHSSYDVSYAPPAYATPSYAPPQYAQPSYSPPFYESSYAPPAYASPTYAPPAYASPTYAPPAYAAPSYAPPSYAAPSYAPPAYAPPHYAAPSYVQPSYSHQAYDSSYAPPAYAPPSYGQPTYASYAPPAYAIPSYAPPSYAQHSYSQPQYNPTYAPPYAAPAVPSYHQPYSPPLYGASYPQGSQSYGTPSYSQPPHNLAYSAPAHAPPSYNQPAYGGSYAPPAYAAPSYYQPNYNYAPVPTYESSYAPPSYPASLNYASAHQGSASHAPPQYIAAPVYNPPDATYGAPAAPVYGAAHQRPQYGSHGKPKGGYGQAPYGKPPMQAVAVSYIMPALHPSEYQAPIAVGGGFYGHVKQGHVKAAPMSHVNSAPSYGATSAPSYGAPVLSGTSYGGSHAPPAGAPSYGAAPNYGNVGSPPGSLSGAYSPAPSSGGNYGSAASPSLGTSYSGAGGSNYGSSAPSYNSASSGSSTATKTQTVASAAYTTASYGVPAPSSSAAYNTPTDYSGSGTPSSYSGYATSAAPASSPSKYSTTASPISYTQPSSPTYTAPSSPSSSYGAARSHGSSYTTANYGAPSYAPASHAEPSYSGQSYSAPSYSPPTSSASAYAPGTQAGGSYSAPTYAAPSYSPPHQAAPSHASYSAPPGYSNSVTNAAPSYSGANYAPHAEAPGSYAEPTYSAPSYSAPSYSAPAPTLVTYAAPSYHAPSEAKPNSAPTTAPATYAASSYSAPSYSAPSYSPAAQYSAPTSAPATYSAPSYSAPTYSAPNYSPAEQYSAPTPALATYSAPSYSASSYSPAKQYSAPTSAPATYSAPSYSASSYSQPEQYSAQAATEANYGPQGHPSTGNAAPSYPAPAYSAPSYSTASYPQSAPAGASYAPASQYVDPAYGRERQSSSYASPAGNGPYSGRAASYHEPRHYEAVTQDNYKPSCPPAPKTCPVCVRGPSKSLLENVCGYDLIVEGEVNYPPQPSREYGGLCSEMCIGDALRGRSKNILDKIRFSLNKYCPCHATAFSFNKVIVLTNRHSWQTHGGYHSQLQLDHSTLVLDHNVENLKALKAALARCPDLRYLHGPYGDEAYNGPAGCPDAFDESCPDCPKAFVIDDVTRDLCSSDYASIVAIGLDDTQMAEHKNGQFIWKRPYLPEVQINEEAGFGKNVSVAIKVNATPSRNNDSSADTEADSHHDSCLTYTVKSLYNVSRGMSPVQDAFDQQLFLNKPCGCNQLKSQLPSYGLLVVDKQSRLSSGVLQLGTGVKLYPLPSGVYKLPSCRSGDFQEEHPQEAEVTDGLIEQLPPAELDMDEEITEEDKTDVAPCPEQTHESCPACLDATEDADVVSQYCNSDYAAVVSIADDVFSSTPYSVNQPWWSPKINVSKVSHQSENQVIISIRAKARYQFPQSDRTPGDPTNPRMCRSGRLHVKEELMGARGEAGPFSFTVLSSCHCKFLDEPTQFAVLVSKSVPKGGPVHLDEEKTLISLPLGKTEFPKCVRPQKKAASSWRLWG